MASIAAKNVAREVLETVRRGKRPVLGKIIRKHGYAKTTSTVPTQVTNTKSYQEGIAPIVEAMMNERDEVIKRMKKIRNKAKYRDMTDALDKLTKNIQLLTGGKTDNSGMKISWE